MILREMTEADVPAVYKIEEVSFSVPWSEDAMRQEVTVQKQAHYLVAEENGDIVGYGGFWQVLDEGHIMNIAVAPDRRRQGIAAALLKELIEIGKTLGILYWTLEVRVSNQAAIQLYEKAGFVSAGVRPGYYEKPREDAYIMWFQDGQ